jgi:hypothetical protein
MVNFASSVAVIDANNVVTTVPLRDHAEPHFFETGTDMGESDLFANDGSIGLDEPELDDVMFLDSLEEMQPDFYSTSQMEMSFNKSMSLGGADNNVPFDLDDSITDVKDVSMEEHLSQLLRQSSDTNVPSEEPSETSSQSEPQPEQPGDGEMMKDMAVAGAIALGLPFVAKFFRRMFFQKDDDVPVTSVADQGSTQLMDPSSSNSVTMSRSELMMASADQVSSRNGAMYMQ